MDCWISNSGEIESVMAWIDDDDADDSSLKVGDQFVDEYGNLVMVDVDGELVLVE